MINEEIKVHNEGYVKLIDIFGEDFTPVDAARISYDNGRKGEEADTKLLNYLFENKHTSPFEQVMIRWEIKAPIFIFREWHRHRTASLNEMSGRYTQLPWHFYRPEEWRAQDTKNKQSSVKGQLPEEILIEADERYNYFLNLLIENYEWAIQNNIAKEHARLYHPVSIYSKMIWLNDLHNTWHFLRLRTGKGAQQEIQDYANAMITLLRNHLPKLMNIYDSYESVMVKK